MRCRVARRPVVGAVTGLAAATRGARGTSVGLDIRRAFTPSRRSLEWSVGAGPSACVSVSGSVLAEIVVSSPQKIFIFVT